MVFMLFLWIVVLIFIFDAFSGELNLSCVLFMCGELELIVVKFVIFEGVGDMDRCLIVCCIFKIEFVMFLVVFLFFVGLGDFFGVRFVLGGGMTFLDFCLVLFFVVMIVGGVGVGVVVVILGRLVNKYLLLLLLNLFNVVLDIVVSDVCCFVVSSSLVLFVVVVVLLVFWCNCCMCGGC